LLDPEEEIRHLAVMSNSSDHRLDAPATSRNRDPILRILRDILPAQGKVLEIASGSGQHVIHFARHLPALVFQPSDPMASARSSIVAWMETGSSANILPPLDLDVRQAPWPVQDVAAILCINMIHISPWHATQSLMLEAGRLLPTGAPLYLYGPFRTADEPLAPSNAAFDSDLRNRNADWGIRNLEAVAELAASTGLMLDTVVPMPANNLSVILRRNGLHPNNRHCRDKRP